MNKLAKGNQNIKANINRVISAENVDSVLQNKVLREGLIKIFNSKDFYNKTLFQLEGHLEANSQKYKSQKAVVTTLNSQVADMEKNLKTMQLQHNDDLSKKNQALEHIQKKYKQKKT